MDDPCRQCENLEQRNRFLSEYYVPLRGLEDSNDGELVEQALRKYHESQQKYKHLIDLLLMPFLSPILKQGLFWMQISRRPNCSESLSNRSSGCIIQATS